MVGNEIGYSQEDEEFIEFARGVLDPKKWGSFLVDWANKLESYGTPRDFADGEDYNFVEIEFENQDYPFVYKLSKNFNQRRMLMKKQKKFIPKSEGGEYGINLNLDDCFLCQDVVKIKDAIKYSGAADNLMYDFGIHYILPARYPGQLGHSLSIPVNHDDENIRVTPIKQENGPKVYMPEEGKTRGHIMSEEYLVALMKDADFLNLLASRNHVLDGMSIPAHDHVHLVPEDLPMTYMMDKIIGIPQTTDFGTDIYRPENTPFDSILIQNENRDILASQTSEILRNLEKGNQVFTFAYKKGQALITPRFRDEEKHEMLQIGCGVPIHYMDTEGQEMIDRIKRWIPMKGKFEWERFL